MTVIGGKTQAIVDSLVYSRPCLGALTSHHTGESSRVEDGVWSALELCLPSPNPCRHLAQTTISENQKPHPLTLLPCGMMRDLFPNPAGMTADHVFSFSGGRKSGASRFYHIF